MVDERNGEHVERYEKDEKKVSQLMEICKKNTKEQDVD